MHEPSPPPEPKTPENSPWDKSLVPACRFPPPSPEQRAAHSSTRLRLSNSPRNTLAVCILATFGAIKRDDLMPAGLRERQSATLQRYEEIKQAVRAGVDPGTFAGPEAQSVVLDEALKTPSPLSAKFRELYAGMLRLRQTGPSA